jgi:hypothetical protein
MSWRLRRAHLSRRVSAAKMVATVGDMCGAHAQILSTGALALAARVSRLKTERFTASIEEEHSLVKTWAMRGTLHVLTAEDLPLYCAARRTTEMYSEPSYLEYLELKLADVEAVLEAIPSALDGKVLTREELADEVVRITKKRHSISTYVRDGARSLSRRPLVDCCASAPKPDAASRSSGPINGSGDGSTSTPTKP